MSLQTIQSSRYFRGLEFLTEVTQQMLELVQVDAWLGHLVIQLKSEGDFDEVMIGLVEDEKVVFPFSSNSTSKSLAQKTVPNHSFEDNLQKEYLDAIIRTKEPQLLKQPLKSPAMHPEQSRYELIVPVLFQEEVVGVLVLRGRNPQTFDAKNIQWLKFLGTTIGPTLSHKNLQSIWDQKASFLLLMGAINRLVIASLHTEHLINDSCKAVRLALGATFVGIALVDPLRRRLVHTGCASHGGEVASQAFLDDVERGLARQVLVSRKTMALSFVDENEDGASSLADHRESAARHISSSTRTKSVLCLPLKSKSEILGVLKIEHGQHNYFSVDSQHTLENLAAYLTQAIKTTQHFESQRRRWQQFLIINEATRVATESLDLDEIIHQVVTETHDRFGYFAVALFLCSEQRVVLKALKSEEPLALKEGYHERFGQGIAGKTVKTGRTILYDGQEQFDAKHALRKDMQSILCVPLRSQIGVIGALLVQSPEPEGFGSDDRLILETLANSVAGAIANAYSIKVTEQIREDLSQMVIHDLRNPVQAVLFTLQEVYRATQGHLSEKVLDSVKEASHCTEDILDLVNSLMDLARFEAGKARLRLAPAALNDHLQAAVRRFALIARSKEVEFDVDLSPDIPVLWLDHELINRTISNLVGNALKFTEKGDRVTIKSSLILVPMLECNLKPPFVLVQVQDTGEGIPPEYKDKIFEKYGQVQTRKAGLKMSTGLGLALCRYVIEAHQGEIWVESQLGEGATFSFILPVNLRDNRHKEGIQP